MKYDIDMNGEFKEIFKKLESILLSYKNIKVIKNEHQTSYKDEYKTVVMLRSNTCMNYFVSSWGQGIKLQKIYPSLSGSGKIVRHLNFNTIEDINEKDIRNMIEESMILNMEDYELKQLKKGQI
jgi:hypothetical protein